jgi:hypothetical protein
MANFRINVIYGRHKCYDCTVPKSLVELPGNSYVSCCKYACRPNHINESKSYNTQAYETTWVGLGQMLSLLLK